jgi:molybdenum cofactor cytidylyltransferase
MAPHVDHIFVITGHNHQLITDLLKDYKKVSILYNADYKEGMYSSIKTGVSAIKGQRFFIIPGDYPHIEAATYKKLLCHTGDVVIPSIDMHAGHPILLSGALKEKLLTDPVEHLRAFINQYEKVYVTVDDPMILFDIDTEEALLKYKRGLK